MSDAPLRSSPLRVVAQHAHTFAAMLLLTFNAYSHGYLYFESVFLSTIPGLSATSATMPRGGEFKAACLCHITHKDINSSLLHPLAQTTSLSDELSWLQPCALGKAVAPSARPVVRHAELPLHASVGYRLPPPPPPFFAPPPPPWFTAG